MTFRAGSASSSVLFSAGRWRSMVVLVRYGDSSAIRAPRVVFFSGLSAGRVAQMAGFITAVVAVRESSSAPIFGQQVGCVREECREGK